MNISNKARYGIRIMLYIALASGKTITVQDVFEKEDVSKRYLEQIFAELKKNGLIGSVKGKHGGYYLAKETKDVTTLEIIVALEGDGSLNSLASSRDKDLEAVLNDSLWNPLQNSIRSLLSAISLEQLLTNYNERLSNMFYI